MKLKKIALVFLVLVLTITGCSKKGESTSSTKNTTENDTKVKTSMGRYVENKVSLPDGLDENATIQLSKKNGMPFLYVFSSGKGNSPITGYEMEQDGTWKVNTPKWLKSVSIPGFLPYMTSVYEDSKGNQYLYYANIKSQSYKGNLLFSKDGSTYKTLKIKNWEEKDSEDQRYNAPSKVNILGNGTIVALFEGGQVDFYNNKTLKLEHSISDSSYVSTALGASGQSVYLITTDDNVKVTGIDSYDASNNYTKTSYPIKSTQSGEPYLDINENNDVLLCNSDGVHILKQGTTTWQTVLDGTLTSMSMQTLFNNGFITDSKANYYVLYNSSNGNGYSIMKYNYDKTIPSVPSTEITVYSLTDKAILRQAAAVFQKNNPEVKVTFKIAMTTDEFDSATLTTKEDYIRSLNTELLAGGGPDILVLDGLPVDSFIEKNVLTDISDTIQPMINNGDLFTNIMDSYKIDGNIYYIPARINLNLLSSKNSDAKNLSTLENISDYAKNKAETSLLGNITLDDFINYFAPYLKDKIINEDGKINKENLVQVLKELKAISESSGIVDKYPNEYSAPNIFSVADGNAQLNIHCCSGFNDAMLQLASVSYVKGSYANFENSFTPSCEIGINHASKNQKLCKEFLSLILSKEIEKNDFRDGFSINRKAFDEAANEKNHTNVTYGMSMRNADGTDTMLSMSPLSIKQKKALFDICAKVLNKASGDDHITQIFKEQAKDFFCGNLSAEETADHIINKANVYLSE